MAEEEITVVERTIVRRHRDVQDSTVETRYYAHEADAYSYLVEVVVYDAKRRGSLHRTEHWFRQRDTALAYHGHMVAHLTIMEGIS